MESRQMKVENVKYCGEADWDNESDDNPREIQTREDAIRYLLKMKAERPKVWEALKEDCIEYFPELKDE